MALTPNYKPKPNDSSSNASSGSDGGGDGEGGDDPSTSGGAAISEDLSGEFPEFAPVSFPTISAANYNFTDPTQFAAQFGDFNRGQISKNFSQSQGFALQALDTELQGLKHFAPAAAAIKQSTINLDNQFNQLQRTRQVNSALPGVGSDLSGQRRRALAYASGRVPDELQDRALELGNRSRSADATTFAGFGRGAQSEKLSDLMSAEERIKLSQYGDQLLTGNIGTKAGLYLAPTEYSNAGSEIHAAPEVGAGRLTYQGVGLLNEATLLSPGQAIQSKIGQEQFVTNIKQRTNEFNATGKFNAATFNSSGTFTAALGAFNYDVAHAQEVAGANQANLNIAAGLGMQGLQSQGFSTGMSAGQSAQTIQSIGQGIGAATGAFGTTSSIFGSGDTGGGVRGGSVDTTPSDGAAPLTSSDFQFGRNSSGPAVAADASSPNGLRVSQGVQAPAGYSPVARNTDGTTSLAHVPSYERELERFSRSSGVKPGSITVANAALMDRGIANAAALSYVPMPGGTPVAMSSTGAPVYALPAAASSGDITAGQKNTDSLALMMATLGYTDPEAMREMGRLSSSVSDVDTLTMIDNLSTRGGPPAAAQGIINKLLGGQSPNLETAEGQQIAYGAQRLGELWSGLSPMQKSQALTAFTGQVVKERTGKDITKAIVPGTEKSPAGSLKVGDAISMTMQGYNGHSLARNWNEISAVVGGAIGTNGVNEIAQVAHSTGLLGFGPQGASVPVPPEYLAKVNARPMPEVGVGAMVFTDPKHVPKHFNIISQTERGVIAMPENLKHTSALNPKGAPYLDFKKARDVSAGKHPSQRMWEKAPGSIVRGSAGGSAMVSGLNIMATANPNLFSAAAAYSLFNNTHGA